MAKGFDRIAPHYEWLEHLLYGSRLQAVRMHLIPFLKKSCKILILGEGDGRFLEKLVQTNADCQITCLELSPKMMARAQNRLPDKAKTRIHWIEADALDYAYPDNAFDSVVSLFFFDVFEPNEQALLIQRVTDSLLPNGLWLYADYSLEKASTNQKWGIQGLYCFFKIFAKFSARGLHSPADAFSKAGYEVLAEIADLPKPFEAIAYRQIQASNEKTLLNPVNKAEASVVKS